MSKFFYNFKDNSLAQVNVLDFQFFVFCMLVTITINNSKIFLNGLGFLIHKIYIHIKHVLPFRNLRKCSIFQISCNETSHLEKSKVLA